MALSVKLPFAGLFRGLFRQAEKPQPAPVAVAASNAAPPPSVVAKNPAPAPASAISSATALHGINNFPAAPNEIELPLNAVVSGLPTELRAKIMTVPSAQATIRLNTAAIVNQLATGTVKITFGDLRRLAPGLIANSGGEHDGRTVTLPLPEILARVNPALLARRPAKKISAHDDIAGPFADRGRGIAFTSAPLKASAAAPQSSAPPAPIKPAPNFDAPPLEPSAPIAFTPRPVAPPPPELAEALRFKTSALNTNVTPAPGAARRAANTTGDLQISLAALAENWPADLKLEISRSPFAGASVSLPEEIVEAGLKRGRVTMTWRQLRLLAAIHSPASPNDALELQLPLKIVAPLFLAAKKNTLPTQTKVAVKSEIPDLFFGFPQPAAAVPPVPGLPTLPKPENASPETNYFVPGVLSQMPAAETSMLSRPAAQLQTEFTSRQTSPKEAIAHAMKLPGVAGAVVALPDGLRVASEVPADLNADTLAAFLPQIFERVNQSTRELRMGALNNVSFTVGNVPWKIFRVNSVYFAAFGRAGESLPSAQLVQLAAAIDRKK